MRGPGDHPPQIALLSPAVDTGNVGDHFIEMAIRRLLRDDTAYQRFTVRSPLTEAEVQAINASDCAILCGTNLYQANWHSALTPQVLSRIVVPVIPFGLGSSAASLDSLGVGETTRGMIQALHGRCVMGSVRDPHSHRVVEAVGVHNAILTGCPVLFWTREPALPTIPPAKRRRIVLTARNWLMHRWPDSVDHPVQIRFLGKLLESFPGDQIVFAVHEEYDARLVDHLDIPRRMVFWSKRPEDYVDLYTDQGSVILAMRLHAGMLGVANGVPALFVAHDTRTYSFTQMMDIDCVGLFEEGSAEQCIIRLRRLLDGDVEPLRKMTEAYQSLHAAMMKFLVVNGLPVRASAQGGHAAPSTSEHHRRD